MITNNVIEHTVKHNGNKESTFISSLGGVCWLSLLLGVGVLRIEGVVLAFVVLSWVAIVILVSQELKNRRPDHVRLECRLTWRRGLFLALTVILWLTLMLAVLSISGLRTYLLTVNLWAIWTGVLLLFARRLEIEWRRETPGNGQASCCDSR